MNEEQSDRQFSLTVKFMEKKGCVGSIPDPVITFMGKFAAELVVEKCGTVVDAKEAFDRHKTCAYPGDKAQNLYNAIDQLMLACLSDQFGPTAAKAYIPVVSFEHH